MSEDAVRRRLTLAATRLEAARRRLRAARAAAGRGDGPPGALAAAMIDHLAAQTEAAAAARAALGRAGDEPEAAATPRLRFARWLVETGRLSDWLVPE